MAVVKGVNSGFVSVSPTADPAGTNVTCNDIYRVFLDTSPSGATKITEVGFWNDGSTTSTNYEMGIYAADGTGGAAGTLIHVSRTNTLGTTSGWKKITVDWSISGNTNYWIGLQVDSVSPNVLTNYSSDTGSFDGTSPASTLPSPYTRTTIYNNLIFSVYALYEATSGPANLKTYNTNLKSNIKTINTNPIANVKSLNTNV